MHKGIQVNKRIGDDSRSQHLRKHNKAVVNVIRIFPAGNRERRRYLAIRRRFCGFHRNHARRISTLTLQDYQSRLHANIFSRTTLTLRFHLATRSRDRESASTSSTRDIRQLSFLGEDNGCDNSRHDFLVNRRITGSRSQSEEINLIREDERTDLLRSLGCTLTNCPSARRVTCPPL